MLQQMIPTVITRLQEVNIFDKTLRKFECFNKGGGEISRRLGWVAFGVAVTGLMQWRIRMRRLGHGMEFYVHTFLLDLTTG
jgi:hypothetical protein